MNMTTNYCGTCALADLENLVCQLTGLPIDPDADYCSHWTDGTDLSTCAHCGQMFMGHGILEQLDDGSWVEFCHQCAKQFGTCAMCKHGGSCRLQGDRSIKVPLMVVKEVRQGNAVVHAQVINPERVKLTCMAGCPCWHEDGYCCKQECRTCGKYNEIHK